MPSQPELPAVTMTWRLPAWILCAFCSPLLVVNENASSSQMPAIVVWMRAPVGANGGELITLRVAQFQ